MASRSQAEINRVRRDLNTQILLNAQFVLNTPTGLVLPYAGASAPSSSWLLCDGAAVSRTTYAALFALISTTFGVGDGSTTFNVPDLRGRVVMMIDGAAARVTSASTGGGNADAMAGVGGAETHTLVLGETPAHAHSLTISDTGLGPVAARGNNSSGVTSMSTDSQGSSNAHSNTQPWIALNYIIKT